ncbi:MAG: autotransporter-associated beta strand repeat-containing protein, partial [Verrucomicrobia bacterium]|nr:autotransporter-associated beta strand repeat-containing protein [Verrucomicrobiota bacterium]
NQEIICTDSSGNPRAFQFKITGGSLQFSMITAGQALTLPIPTTGNDAFVAGAWYHVAVTYNGTTATLYWTLLNPTNGAAHVLGTASLTLGTATGAAVGPLCIGNENRGAAGEQFLGCIDEVRISSVARGSGEMQFFSPLVTVTANPISQNVDYNQPVNFSVGASSQFALGYQWRFNSNSVAGLTNSAFTITNVAAGNAGYFDCVVTNSIGFAATSSPALLVVGAANFLANRYSFTTDTTDSIGGQTGTNFGNATVSGGQLVLDGTSGTYMQLPPNLFNGGNATALTVEFWATFGVNSGFSRVFDFGYTNVTLGVIVGVTYVGFTPHNNSSGHQILINSASDNLFQQVTTASGILDGLTRHIACVIDPPNKIMAIYTNGVLESVNTNMTVPISSLNDTFSYIGRSLFPADPYLNASIDELRIFKGALSSITIKQSDDQGPNTLLADGPGKFVVQPVSTAVPVGQTATFTAAAVGYLPITYQWFKNGTPITGATNGTLSFATVIGDNGAGIFCHATNTIGVTTYITNSTTATLIVFLPPTLAWLDAADGGADNFWNTTSLNWTNDVSGGGVVAFSPTNGVLFDDRGSGSPNVDIQQPVTLYGVAVNAASDYMFYSSSGTGALTGQAALTKANSGRLTIDVTNTLSGPVTISGGTLQVGNNDSLGSLGSGPVTNNATLSITRGDTALNIANPIRGTGTVSFDGNGGVTVTGNNTYSGNTLVNAGIVFLASSTGFGATNVGTSVANGGQVYITANVNLAEGLTLNGAGDGNGALRKGAAGLTVDTASVLLASDSTIGLDSGATLTLSNTVSGTAALTANGTGTLTFNANNSFTGGFTLNGPVVGLNSTGALGTNAATIIGAGRFVIGDGLNITNPITANTVSPGVATGLLMVNDNTNGAVTTVSGPLTFAVAPGNGGNFVGPTTSGYLNIAGRVTASGLITSVRFGNVRFSGGGDYAELQVRANTTSIGINNGVATNAVADIGGNGSPTVPTFLDLNGFNQQLAGLKNTVTPANLGIVTNSGATVKTLTLDLGATGYSFSGGVAGKVALQLNSGTQIFTGTNTYTGNTTLNGGTLELATASIYSNSTVSIASGATLQLDFPDTNRVASLVLNGVTQPNGTYNNNNASSYITGSGSLLVLPSVNTAPTNVVAKVNGGNLELSWPADHVGWRLQVQTNSLAGGLKTNWVDVPNANTVSSVTNAINTANGAVFYRMIYP